MLGVRENETAARVTRCESAGMLLIFSYPPFEVLRPPGTREVVSVRVSTYFCLTTR